MIQYLAEVFDRLGHRLHLPSALQYPLCNLVERPYREDEDL